MKKSDEKIVRNVAALGLPEKEAQMYVAALELGKGTVSKIARRAGVSRTNAYNLLDSLASKGLVRVSGKEPKEEYAAESPDALLAYVRTQHEEAEKNLMRAEDFVLELRSIHKKSDRPQVRFYEGVEGLKQVYEDTLTSTEPIRAFANVEEMHRALKSYFPRYYQRRAEKGIFIKAVMASTPTNRERSRHDKEEARETALVPENRYQFHPEINIYDNKVMIASWREELGIIIESDEIAAAMKTIFDLSWEEAKRLDAKEPGKQAS